MNIGLISDTHGFLDARVIKLFEDCMTKLLFWNDDSQVARLIVEKQWGDNPGFEVKIKELRNE